MYRSLVGDCVLRLFIRYIWCMQVGAGASGQVYLCKWRAMTVAVKFTISKDNDSLARNKREALLSRLASHPHLVQTYAVGTTVVSMAASLSRLGYMRGGSFHGVLKFPAGMYFSV